MSKFKAPKSVITVDGIELVGYRTQSGQWVMSMTTLANVLGLTTNSVSDFLGSDWLKSRIGCEPFHLISELRVEGSNKKVKGIPVNIIYLFFLFKITQGSNPAALHILTHLAASVNSIIVNPLVNSVPDTQLSDKRDTRVYVMEDKNSPICKIGISKNPETRVKSLSYSSGRQLNLVWVSKRYTTKVALEMEKYLHTTFHPNRLPGEWFSLPSSEVVKVSQKLVDTPFKSC